MNYLQLCQRLVIETGIADSGPAAVTGQVGDMKRVVDWVNDSWLKIQSLRPDWKWMWSQTSTTLSSGTNTITLAADVESIEGVRVDGDLIKRIPYETYAKYYYDRDSSKPILYCIRPDGVVAFNTDADSNYTVTFDYYKVPEAFSAGTSVPGLASRYHMLIVYDALRQYAQFDEAQELERKAFNNYEDMLADLSRDQLDECKAPVYLA